MGRPRSPKLSVDRIVSAAMDLVDSEGLDALTMRALSKRLGAKPASVYNHIESRDHLLDLMIARVMEAIDLEPIRNPDLSAALIGQALAFLEAVAKHPHLAEVIAIRPVRSSASFTYYELMLARLTEAGMPPDDALCVLYAIDDFALGAAVNNNDNIDLEGREDEFPLLARARGATPTHRRRALEAIIEGLTSQASITSPTRRSSGSAAR